MHFSRMNPLQLGYTLPEHRHSRESTSHERTPAIALRTRQWRPEAPIFVKSGNNMRLFHLERTEDASGVSGIGTVAEGVVFDDGSVALRWLTTVKSTVLFESIADVESVHGHQGKTIIVYD